MSYFVWKLKNDKTPKGSNSNSDDRQSTHLERLAIALGGSYPGNEPKLKYILDIVFALPPKCSWGELETWIRQTQRDLEVREKEMIIKASGDYHYYLNKQDNTPNIPVEKEDVISYFGGINE